MNRNLGKIDRGLRIILGVIIFAWGMLNNSWLALFGLIPFLTGIIAWCPLYCPIKFSTCTNKNCK